MVEVKFLLCLSDGTVVDQTDADEVMAFQVGDGQWLPALEEKVLSVPVGEVQQFLIAPEDAFGFPDPEQIHWLPITDLGDMAVETNQIIEFDLPNGDAIAARVLAVEDERVQCDFSHPLAGQELLLEVERVR